jgi:hypothetical protein
MALALAKALECRGDQEIALCLRLVNHPVLKQGRHPRGQSSDQQSICSRNVSEHEHEDIVNRQVCCQSYPHILYYNHVRDPYLRITLEVVSATINFSTFKSTCHEPSEIVGI